MSNCKELDKRTKAYKQCIENQNEGLGDKIEKVFEATGIKKVVDFIAGKDCGCNKRRDKLNNLFPVRRKPIRCFSENQYNEYKTFTETRTLNLWNEKDIKLLIDLYAHVFAVQYDSRRLCKSCAGSANLLFKMTEELDKVFNTYKTK